MKRRRHGLMRRYGHATMASVHSATAEIRKLARDNAPITAALLGAAAGAVSSELGVGTAALVGGVAGVAIEQATKR